MSRLALYRKWRPMTFRDVVEQRHVVDTLKNSLKADAIGHAYLFCGTRGTGKTSIAKIFSRAINCLAPQDGSPCNQCSVCRGILDGNILDVIEMDAASNNSVDNIRDIRDEVVYAPAVARYKVYIIDEVHMLSAGAFNALLKTLEEPPERVVFILATTEPQKLPATVLSRCQRFDFKRITENGIAERLGEIAADCGISVSPDALTFLARLSGGAMRDAISLLDQLTTLGHSEVTLADVNEMAGFASSARIRLLAGFLLAGDIAGSWIQLDALMREGRDLSQLCVQLLGWFRNALLLQMGGESSPLLDVHPDDMTDAMAASKTLSEGELADWLRELSEYELRLRRTDNPRIMMEVLLLRLCMRATGKGNTQDNVPAGRKPSAAVGLNPVAQPASIRDAREMEERIARLERQVSDFGQALSSGEKSRMPATVRQPDSATLHPADAVEDATVSPPAFSGSTASHFTPWARVIDEIRKSGSSKSGSMKLFAYILDTECLQVGEDQLRIVISAEDLLKKKVLSQTDSIGMIMAAAQKVTGSAWQVRIVDSREAAALKTGSIIDKSGKPGGGLADAPISGTGDDALDRLLVFGLEKGIPITVKDE